MHTIAKPKGEKKEKIYSCRLVLEVYEGGKFQKFVMFPCCHCNRPNGLIICGHLGALMLLIHSISCLLVDKNFEDMLCCFPEPDTIFCNGS